MQIQSLKTEQFSEFSRHVLAVGKLPKTINKWIKWYNKSGYPLVDLSSVEDFGCIKSNCESFLSERNNFHPISVKPYTFVQNRNNGNKIQDKPNFQKMYLQNADKVRVLFCGKALFKRVSTDDENMSDPIKDVVINDFSSMLPQIVEKVYGVKTEFNNNYNTKANMYPGCSECFRANNTNECSHVFELYGEKGHIKYFEGSVDLARYLEDRRCYDSDVYCAVIAVLATVITYNKDYKFSLKTEHCFILDDKLCGQVSMAMMSDSDDEIDSEEERAEERPTKRPREEDGDDKKSTPKHKLSDSTTSEKHHIVKTQCYTESAP
jgi:hypothetical protein